jgi:7-keto-8-aminopelargonate synthetase-like enzyme
MSRWFDVIRSFAVSMLCVTIAVGTSAQAAAAVQAIIGAIRALVEWISDDAAPMPPSTSLAALVAMLEANREARADIIAQARATPELEAQLAALCDAYESIYPSLTALRMELEAE